MPRSPFLLSLILCISLSGCLPAPQTIPAATASPVAPVEIFSITGRVIDLEGKPVARASITSEYASAASDVNGWFELPSARAPVWVRAEAEGYMPRVRAAAPDAPVLLRLTPDDGKTIAIQFGGDTMFGRRFFDPNEDGDTSDGLLPPVPGSGTHLELLAPIAPLLGKSDLTVLNLESPLTDRPYLSPRDARPAAYHSTKDYVFASHTGAAAALKQLGVDAVDLGNNHLYDLLEGGVQSTISALEQVDMHHFGGGMNEAGAWAPAVVTVKGQRIAFIGCTTIGQPIPPATDHDVTYTASDTLKKGGAAACEESRLRSAVSRAKQDAEIVVVMIHGGFEYERLPSNNITRLSLAAREAGARLIVNHHPHVIGSFLWEQDSLVAWSMGNFIFDQMVWPTFESYLLTVYLRNGEVIRAHADPLMLQDFTPRGLTGSQADHVIRNAASSPGSFVMENGILELDISQQAIETVTRRSLDGGPGEIIAIPREQWISGFEGPGSLRLGRDLLWVGGFENEQVRGASQGAPLWDLTKDSLQYGKEYAYEGHTGIRLTRSSSNLSAAATSHLHRILITPEAHLSLTGMIRASEGAAVLLQISWYSDTIGPSYSQTTLPITVETSSRWQSFRIDAQAPPEAVAMSIYLRLNPPARGIVTADFDNLRIIEWAGPATEFSRRYDHALLTGSGEITLSRQVLPGAGDWLAPPGRSKKTITPR